ncbi:hypothetical protein GRI89_01605 [Altererythrobacter salegens]|uniref:Uncharacterized protein n=1 Tax=Croceibacterium salegens TaxID=1737568 RepID=A0A6I4STJ0_9SPHN|nr:hypothetical protein [Croceibacterium salegens]MXO58240.1 hypothetical protein [Croceibacterium salegens]
MSDETLSPAEARAMLDSVGATRAQLAALGNCPPWRHAAFGGIIGLLVTGVGFPIQIQTATLCVAMGGLVLVGKSDRRRYGMFVNGYRKGATRPFTFALLVAMLALIVAQIWLRENDAAAGTHFAVGLAAFLIGTGCSVIWNRIFRREMEGRA